MKSLTRYDSLLISLGALGLGIILVLNTDQAFEFVIQFLGILATIVGFVVTTVQLIQNGKTKPSTVPYFGIFALVFGVLLLVRPDVWTNLFMIILGVTMILMSINQLISYRAVSRLGGRVSAFYYIFSILLALAGILTILEPTFIKGSIVLFIGIWMILYGIVEFIGFLTLKKQ